MLEVQHEVISYRQKLFFRSIHAGHACILRKSILVRTVYCAPRRLANGRQVRCLWCGCVSRPAIFNQHCSCSAVMLQCSTVTHHIVPSTLSYLVTRLDASVQLRLLHSSPCTDNVRRLRIAIVCFLFPFFLSSSLAHIGRIGSREPTGLEIAARSLLVLPSATACRVSRLHSPSMLTAEFKACILLNSVRVQFRTFLWCRIFMPSLARAGLFSSF